MYWDIRYIQSFPRCCDGMWGRRWAEQGDERVKKTHRMNWTNWVDRKTWENVGWLQTDGENANHVRCYKKHIKWNRNLIENVCTSIHSHATFATINNKKKRASAQKRTRFAITIMYSALWVSSQCDCANSVWSGTLGTRRYDSSNVCKSYFECKKTHVTSTMILCGSIITTHNNHWQ